MTLHKDFLDSVGAIPMSCQNMSDNNVKGRIFTKVFSYVAVAKPRRFLDYMNFASPIIRSHEIVDRDSFTFRLVQLNVSLQSPPFVDGDTVWRMNQWWSFDTTLFPGQQMLKFIKHAPKAIWISNHAKRVRSHTHYLI